MSAFCRHIVRDSLRSRIGKKPVREASKVRASVKTVRASVKTMVFIHISLAIARVSAKEQQEPAMCSRWDRVNKTYGSAIVIDMRTEGSKGFGHGSNGFKGEVNRATIRPRKSVLVTGRRAAFADKASVHLWGTWSFFPRALWERNR